MKKGCNVRRPNVAMVVNFLFSEFANSAIFAAIVSLYLIIRFDKDINVVCSSCNQLTIGKTPYLFRPVSTKQRLFSNWFLFLQNLHFV